LQNTKEITGMKTKEEIVKNWLPRYTGQQLEQFGKYILLTNFSNYVALFAQWHGVEVVGKDKPMPGKSVSSISGWEAPLPPP
jgi:AMP nucleosidase